MESERGTEIERERESREKKDIMQIERYVTVITMVEK